MVEAGGRRDRWAEHCVYNCFWHKYETNCHQSRSCFHQFSCQQPLHKLDALCGKCVVKGIIIHVVQLDVMAFV